MQRNKEDLRVRLYLTCGGELSFLSMVGQDLLLSNFRPKLLRFRSTSSYGFSFSVEMKYLWLSSYKLMCGERASHKSNKGMNRGQQRVLGAQLGLDIAAKERSESKRWVKGHAQLARVNSFSFSPPVTVSTEPSGPSGPIWNSWTQHYWWVTVQACSTACCEKHEGDSPSQEDTLSTTILSFTCRWLWPFHRPNVQTCLMRLPWYNDNATVASSFYFIF